MAVPGYQLIEPATLDRVFAVPGNFAIAVAMFHWLIDELHRELGDQLQGVTLQVVRVEYLGAYPALGLQYEREGHDVGPLVEQTIERILRSRPVASFAQFVGQSRLDWDAVMRGGSSSGR